LADVVGRRYGAPMANYEDSFGFLLKRAQHALELTTERQLQSAGLTLAQYSALAALEGSDGKLSNAELARRSFVTAQTMHRVVALLERSGWVTRKAHPRHGRIQDVILTRKGKLAVAKAHKVVGGIEAASFGSSPERDVKAAAKVLEKALGSLDQT
jgi:DNA-binding MarR family transcriptional regulator